MDIIDVTPCQQISKLDKATSDLYIAVLNIVEDHQDEILIMNLLRTNLRMCYDLEKSILFLVDDEPTRRAFLARIDVTRDAIYTTHADVKNTVDLNGC